MAAEDVVVHPVAVDQCGSRAGVRGAIGIAALALVLAMPALATPPDLAFAPDADADGTPDGGSPTPSLEVQFAGTAAQIVVTPSGGSGSQPADQTSLICSIGGDPAIVIANNSGVLFFQGNSTPAQPVQLQCTPGAETKLAVLSCNQKKGGIFFSTSVWDVACPVVGQPEFVSSPAAGATLSLNADFPANATATLTVSNTGGATLSVTGATGLLPPLSVAPVNAMIGTGAAQDFVVTCSGAVPGTYLGNFTVATNDGDEASNNYGVDCTIASAEFNAVPAPPGPVPLATTQGTNTGASIAVSNPGNAPLMLGALGGLSGRLSASLSPPGAIAPAGNATINVSCDGSTAGTSSQTLAFTTNDPDDGEGSIAYDVACTVSAAPAPEFSSSPAAPGPIVLTTGQGTNVSAPLTIQNAGSAPMTLALSVAPAAPVSVTGLASPIGAGSSIVLMVNCDASAPGNFARSFTLASNDADEPSVGFTVDCNVGAPPPPEFDSTPAAPGPLAISTFQGSNASTPLVLRNTGSTPLQITGFSALPAPFSLSPSTPAAIAPGQSLDYTLTCSGAITGFFTGTLTVNTNDGSEPAVNFDLQCRVQPNGPEFASAPPSGASLAISTVAGESSAAFIFINNQGNQPLNLNVAPPQPPLSTSFSVTSVPPGQNRPLRVICQSPDRVSSFQNLTIATNDGDENPVNYTVTCNVTANARSSFRRLLTSGAFTYRKTDRILKDSFE